MEWRPNLNHQIIIYFFKKNQLFDVPRSNPSTRLRTGARGLAPSKYQIRNGEDPMLWDEMTGCEVVIPFIQEQGFLGLALLF
jgi:hypothetical protein